MNLYDSGVFLQPPPELEPVFASTSPLSFFLLPEWFWLIHQYGLAGKSQLKLAADEKLGIGLALLQTGRSRTRGCTNLYTCEYDLLGCDLEPKRMCAFARDCAVQIPIDVIRLEGIHVDSASFEAFQSGFRSAGLVVKSYFGWGTWFEDTRELTFADYIDGRPAILRNTWKRKLQALKRSSFQIRVLQAGEDPSAFFAAYETVHTSSWKGPEPFPRFLRHAVRLAAEKGALRMGVLTIDQVPAAAQFWFLWHGRAVIFKLAYDSRFAQFSPGTVLTMHMMQSVLEKDRPHEISFGRGDDPYKKLWFSRRREHWGIEAANPRTAIGFVKATPLLAALSRDAVLRKFRSRFISR